MLAAGAERVCVSAVATQTGRECHSQGQHSQEKGPTVLGCSRDTGASSSQRMRVGVGAGGMKILVEFS